MSRLLLLSIAACFVFYGTVAELHCYMPDGTLDDRGTSPCNSTAAVSACCDPRDSCSTSGLCLGASGWIYRSACTDKSWTARECPSQCQIDPILKVRYSTFAPIFPCSAGVGTGSFCCGSYASTDPNCCDSSFTLGNTGQAFKPGNDALLAQLANASALAAATVTVTASATAATATAASATSGIAESSSSSGTNLGTAIGVGVGVPLGVLAIGVLGFLFWRERRRNNSVPPPAAGSVPAWSTYGEAPPQMAQDYGTGAAESPYQQGQQVGGASEVGSSGLGNRWKPLPAQTEAIHELRA